MYKISTEELDEYRNTILSLQRVIAIQHTYPSTNSTTIVKYKIKALKKSVKAMKKLEQYKL